jgi:hypothetical protein
MNHLPSWPVVHRFLFEVTILVLASAIEDGEALRKQVTVLERR